MIKEAGIEISVLHDGLPVKRQRFKEGSFLVGSRNANLALRFPTVSKTHGSFDVLEGHVFYRDHGSRNGSKLGGTPLVANVAHEWPSGAMLSIGPFSVSWTNCVEKSKEMALEQKRDLAREYLELQKKTLEGAREIFLARPDVAEYWDDLHREFHGDGPVAKALANPACKEIIANAHDQIFVDEGEGLQKLASSFLLKESYEAWVFRLAQSAGRRLDLQNPICEATLANGARFHAVLPPIAAHSISVAIRRFGSAPVTEQGALESEWITKKSLEYLKRAIREKKNLVISGGTSSGKTSLLNFLSSFLDPLERVITVEDTLELKPPVKNLVQLQARQANADGVGAVHLRQLVQSALRMRPDRIIVGECRGAEVLEMLQALNTGHPGSLTTIHANSPIEALHRLELLALLGAPNLSLECIQEWIKSTVQIIVQVERGADGKRRISAISEQRPSGLESIYEYDFGQMGQSA